jgi:hypothetical protein
VQAALLLADLALCRPSLAGIAPSLSALLCSGLVLALAARPGDALVWWQLSEPGDRLPGLLPGLHPLHCQIKAMSDETGSASTAGVEATTTKDSYIPLFSGAPPDYKEWRRRLNIYVMKMRVAKLTGTAWKLLENFPIEEIEKTRAFNKMLKILDKAFQYDKTGQLPNDFDRYFTGLQRRPAKSLLEYTTEHDHLYSKLADHDVTLPSKVQGWHLLRRAGLSREQKQLVTTQAPNLERNKVQEALFLILGQDHKTVAGGGHHPQHRGFRSKGRGYAVFYEGDDHQMMDGP